MGITRFHPCLFSLAMAPRLQSTRLQTNIGEANGRLERWALNPWRRLSLVVIALLLGFLIGSAVTSVAGVLGQMDPVAALLVVVICELGVRLRSNQRGTASLLLQLVDMLRIGILYGLFLEAFKLI